MPRPRILFLCSRLPYPVVGGDRLRVTNCARILRREYEVDLLGVSALKPDQETLDALHGMFDRVQVFQFPRQRYLANALLGTVRGLPAEVAAYDFPEIHRWLRAHAHEYQLGWCHLVRMSRYSPDMPTPKVIDLADAISKHYTEAARVASPLWRPFYLFQKGRVLKYEGRAIGEFDRAFIHTPEDRAWLSGAFPAAGGRIVVSEMGAPSEFFSSAPSTDLPFGGSGPNLAFFGKMNYRPNEDAAVYFARVVLPLVRRQLPAATFTVIGAFPTKKVRQLRGTPGVKVTGFLEDPVPALASADIVVAPMRIGGGMQNKVIQAMALGRAVVATPLALRGIGGVSGVHYVSADGPDALARAVIDLNADAGKRSALGREARALILEQFTWDKIGDRLLEEVRALIAPNAVGRP